MKKILLVGICAAFAGALSAQKIADTNPANKNVVLEEFTGKTCGYCPDGHKKGDEFSAANPGRVVLINIHCGNYASGTPNYNVMLGGSNYGNDLYRQPGVNLRGFPAGTVNRTLFSASSQDQGNPGTAQSRGSWSSTGATVMTEASPVNVAVRGYYDPTTFKLYVQVEAYYTADEANALNKINVGVMQDKIWGPQSGGSNFYPAKYDASKAPNSYRHDHMLREVLTGQWGEDITTTSKGSLYSKIYVWDVPQMINSIPVVPADLSVYAFVAEGQQTVISGDVSHVVVQGGKVDPENPQNPLSIGEAKVINNVNVYPNPTLNVATLDLYSDVNTELTFKIVSVTGQVITSFNQQVDLGNNKVELDLSAYESGYYFIELSDETGVITRQRLIKR